MRPAAVLILASLLSGSVRAAVVYSQPHNNSGTLYQSSWWNPNDSDYDIHTWDSFTLSTDRAITEVTWRGGNIYGGSYGGPVVNFTVAFYPSIAAGSQPDVVNPPLVQYETGGNAGQTYAGTFGGVAMYDYHFTLPAPFQAAANTKYWVYILAWQNGIPEWGFAAGSGGNGSYFRWVRGLHMYQSAPGDLCFTLYGSDAPTYTISAGASPVEAGAVQGAGAYPQGSTASLVAIANSGWGFVNWTEDNVEVSTSAQYSFIVNADRTLVAHFAPAYTVSTSPAPSYAGSTTGDGTFNAGATVTVSATANQGYTFANWTEYGNPVSASATYQFSAASNRVLVANFAPDAGTVTFDFDNAPAFTSLPIDVTVDGLTAHLSATGCGFSIQHADTLGFTPAGFGGNCIYPNSVFPADFLADFSAPLTYFSILYSPQELGCDDSATMRVTAYLDGAYVGTATATAPVHGTWPTGRLSFSSAQPFNSVVVHYDQPPPTCQDWGPIFLADNMTVTRTAPACPADLDGDGAVGLSDLSVLLTNYGAGGGMTPADGDLDGDGDVDLADLSALLERFGVSC